MDYVNDRTPLLNFRQNKKSSDCVTKYHNLNKSVFPEDLLLATILSFVANEDVANFRLLSRQANQLVLMQTAIITKIQTGRKKGIAKYQEASISLKDYRQTALSGILALVCFTSVIGFIKLLDYGSKLFNDKKTVKSGMSILIIGTCLGMAAFFIGTLSFSVFVANCINSQSNNRFGLFESLKIVKKGRPEKAAVQHYIPTFTPS
jgi:hypothetical protein